MHGMECVGEMTRPKRDIVSRPDRRSIDPTRPAYVYRLVWSGRVVGASDQTVLVGSGRVIQPSDQNSVVGLGRLIRCSPISKTVGLDEC